MFAVRTLVRCYEKSLRETCWLSRFFLPGFSALRHRAAEEEVVIAGRLEPRIAQRRGDLRPVPHFMDLDVEQQFARR